jgi:hypothetical protein
MCESCSGVRVDTLDLIRSSKLISPQAENNLGDGWSPRISVLQRQLLPSSESSQYLYSREELLSQTSFG